ncbi:MAG: hypothetical protein WCI89_00945 [bacterium]
MSGKDPSDFEKKFAEDEAASEARLEELLEGFEEKAKAAVLDFEARFYALLIKRGIIKPN